MKQSFFTFLFLLTSFVGFAQQDSLAVIRYQEAESAFQNDNFPAAIQLLEKTEQLLSKTNNKILYLKIRSLNELYRSDSRLANKMALALADFNGLTNKSSYPAEKLLEIEKIESQFNSFKSADRQSFEQATSASTLDALDTHLRNYPATFFRTQSDSVKQAIAVRQQKEQLSRNQEQKNTLLSDAGKLNRQAAGKTIKGSILLAAGLGGAAYSGYKAYDYYFVKLQKDNTPGDYSNAGKTPADLQGEYKKMAIIYGSSAVASLLVGLPWGLSSLKKARHRRQEAHLLREKATRLQVTMTPHINPLANHVGFALHVKF